MGNTSLASIPLLNGAVDPATNVIVPTKSIAGLPTSVNHTPTPNVVAGDVLGVHVNVGGAVDGYCTMNRAILSLVDPIPVTDDNKIVQVNSGGTGYQLTVGVNNGLFGRLLSFLNLQSVLAETTSVNLALTGTAPTLGNTTQLPDLVLLELLLLLHHLLGNLYINYNCNSSNEWWQYCAIYSII